MTALSDAVEMVLAATEGTLVMSTHQPVSSTPASVRVLLAAGEDVVAYETLCHNLYEIGARPPSELARELRRSAVQAGADSSLAELLL